jgi:hypothetical protein
MSTICPQGPAYQVYTDAENFQNQSIPYMLALSFFIAILAGTTKRCLTSKWDSEILHFTFIFSLVWSFPVMIYFLYHRTTLPVPEWLTSGRPVTFGGIAPNVCKAGQSGHWPCFPNDFKNWLANVYGLKDWEHLVPRGCTSWLCLIFLALNLMLLVIARENWQN